MHSLSSLAQPGLLTDPTPFVEYLTFTLKQGAHQKALIDEALGDISGIDKSIHQKDPVANLSVTVGFSHNGWKHLFPNHPMPAKLKSFPDMKQDDRHFPETPGDIFFMIKSQRIDLNFQAAKYIRKSLSAFCDLIEDIQGYKYLDNRDMIDFVDGTENPVGNGRNDAVLVKNDCDMHKGGSYLVLQRYIDRQSLWDDQSTEYQEQVIGRTKMDNIELTDEEKPAWAHNAKSKVEINGEEIKMLRQNRPFGNALEHGTMFVGFAESPDTIEISLKQMIFADENGNYDRLLDFVDAKTGVYFFIPSLTFLDQFGD